MNAFGDAVEGTFLLQSVVRKMAPGDAPKISDQIMTALLRMFENTSGKAGNVQEDALVAVSTLSEGWSLP